MAAKTKKVSIPTYKVITVHKPVNKSTKADLAEEVESLVEKGYELLKMREQSSHVHIAVFVRRREASIADMVEELCEYESGR